MIYNRQSVLKVISKVLECDENQITEESGLTKTLRWDSLNHVVILSSLENYFDIKVPDEMFANLLTVKAIYEYLDNYESSFDYEEIDVDSSIFVENEKRVEFQSKDGTKLVGIFHTCSQAPKGFIILTHGIPSDKDEGKFYKYAAAYFAKFGFDSFRFDFRHMGESQEGKESDISLVNLTEDVESAYLLVNNSLARNKAKRYVVGTSCGGGLLLKWINDYDHSSEINEAFLCCPVLDYVYECTGKEKSEVIAKKQSYLDAIDKIGYVEDRDAQYGKQFFLDALDFDASEQLHRYGKKIEIYHGNQDPSVPYEISAKFAEMNADLATLITVDWSRHGFGVPFLNKKGERIPDEKRAVIKRNNQVGVIHSICCAIRGKDNGID